ncbi:MAG: SAM-dependent methyltransferase [Bacteroidota bacterium]
MDQLHLKSCDRINYGSYYTPKWVVDIVYKFLNDRIKNINDYFILDTSCGYGSFLRGEKAIGADIDKKAISVAIKNFPQYTYFHHNSLLNIAREKYNLSEQDKIIIVGNPPYNDITSIIRNNIKQNICSRDHDVASRDFGISFLLSYSKLRADYVCVLHPLSYLIKKTNFDSLGNFKNNYRLKDALIISSCVFTETSKSTCFPIIIALYENDLSGMDYNFIYHYEFKTADKKIFSLNQFDYISNYLTKYPNQKYVRQDDTIAYFWTMRDINALKRSRTFVFEESYNTIRVTKDFFAYYCYVDIFKEYISHIPYYLGNCDIVIDDKSFNDVKEIFINKCIRKYPGLQKYFNFGDLPIETDRILDEYFKKLLREHYVD